MYRVLAENKAVRERRAQRSHPNHPKPEIVARAPNSDITRLLGPEKWRTSISDSGHLQPTSRAGWWRTRPRAWAGACRGNLPQASPGCASRTGAPMTDARRLDLAGHAVAEPSPDLERQPVLRREYHPGFPGRFAGIEEAKDFCRRFFPWYTWRQHGGIGLLTPAGHLGRAPEVIRRRQDSPPPMPPGPSASWPARPGHSRRRSGSTAHSPSEVDGAEPGDGADGHGKEGSLT